MAERPSDIQNWQKRQFISFGPHFRIDSGNPQMGLNGEMVYNLFAETDSGDSNISVGAESLYNLRNGDANTIVGHRGFCSLGQGLDGGDVDAKCNTGVGYFVGAGLLSINNDLCRGCNI